MTTAVNPPAASRREFQASTPPRQRSNWVARLPLAILLAVGGVELFFIEKLMRGVEVTLSSHLLPFLFSWKSLAAVNGGDPVVLFRSDDSWLGLRMTPECSIAFYVGAIMLFGAVMLLIRRFSVLRVLLATVLATGTMILLNQVRLVALAWVFATHGRDAFEWAHSLGGSFLMLGGLAVSLTLFFVVVVRGKRSRRRL